jgi:hypothetical protein
MNELKLQLLREAERRYGRIHPCGNKTFDECYSIVGTNLLFWFNDEADSSHVVRAPSAHIESKQS